MNQLLLESFDFRKDSVSDTCYSFIFFFLHKIAFFSL